MVARHIARPLAGDAIAKTRPLPAKPVQLHHQSMKIARFPPSLNETLIAKSIGAAPT
jgi:hypothetical protein